MGQFKAYQTTNGNTITVSDSEPANPQVGDVWIDTSYVDPDGETVLCHYKLNEASGTVVADASDNAYHATNTDATIVDGLYTGSIKALQGGGSGYITLPAGATLADKTNFKLEVYLRKDADTGDATNRSLVNQYVDISSANKGFTLYNSSSNYITFSLRTAPSNYYNESFDVACVIGTVYKVVFEYTGTIYKFKLYSVNAEGALTLLSYKSKLATGAINSNLRPMVLLANNNETLGDKAYFTIDDLKITYNAA